MDVLTDDESENFINLVSKHPCLFDCKHPNYKDARIKENIWKEIAQEINKTSENCKKQWKTIRDGYMRFKRKNKLPTGSEAPKSNRTKWKLYRLLSFLDNVLQERSSISSVDGESQNNGEESAESAQNNIQQETDATLSEANTQEGNASMNTERNVPAPPTAVGPKKRIKKRPRSSRDDILSYMRERENSRQSLMKNMSGTDGEFKSFGIHIEHVLKNLPTRLLQIKAKQEIFEVLTKFEILAADNSTISSSSTPSTSRDGTAITTVSDDSQYTILNVYSPINAEPTDFTYARNAEFHAEPTDFTYARNAEFHAIVSEPTDLTYARNAEFQAIVSEANDLTHQTENQKFPSISEFLNT